MGNMRVNVSGLVQAGADAGTIRWVEQAIDDACSVIADEDAKWGTRAFNFYPGLKDERDRSVISVALGAGGARGRAEGRSRDELRDSLVERLRRALGLPRS